MIVDDLAALATPLDELRPLNVNPRRGDVEAIARSLAAFGQRKPIVANRTTGEVIAGNHTLLAARSLSWPEVAVVWVTDDEATAHAYALADNRTAELGGYDDEALAALIAEVRDADEELFAATGWAEDDLQALLDQIGAEPTELATDPDEVPDRAPAITQPGDVWVLGQHRLVCGDATDPGVIDASLGGATAGCLLTDPPYGIDLDTDWSTISGSPRALLPDVPGRKHRPVLGDDQPFDAAPIRDAFAATREQFWFGADYYRRTLSPDDLDGSWLVWDKRTESADAGFGSGFELIWSAEPHKRDLLRVYWFGVFGDAEARRRLHPTQKPSKLLATILDRWAPAGCLVADPFAGSGTTAIAAELTGRRAALVELDPAYCDVIAKRVEQATGVVPVLEATGEPRSFLD